MTDAQMPPGWVEVSLDELLTESLANGRSVSTVPEGFPVLRLTALKRGVIDLNERKLGAWSAPEAQPYLVAQGDFFVSRGNGSLSLVERGGLVEVEPDEVAYPDTLIRVRTDHRLILSRYLRAVWDSSILRRQIERTARTTAGIYKINQQDMHSFRMPLPPLAEQRRIVEAIEEQFTRLDAAVAGLKRVQQQLKRYRAAVLKAACEGRLVPTEADLARAEGREHEPADKLLERILEERRAAGRAKYKEPITPSPGGSLPEGWVWATIEQLNRAERPCAYGVLQPGPDVPGGVPFIRVGDINGGTIDMGSLKHISPEIAGQYPRTRLQGGELLITLVGTIGRTAIVPTSLSGANTARAVGVVPLVSQVHAQWPEVWFRNPEKIDEMTRLSHEVARKTLNLEDVRAATVALPPLAEQERIVAEVERRLSVVEKAEATVEASLKRAARMRQAILKRAFEGKLVPQDPNDEPASVLLERIRAARERQSSTVTRRGRKRTPQDAVQLPLTENGIRHDLDVNPAAVRSKAVTE